MTSNELKPKEIVKCSITGYETASFGYYDGLQYCKDRDIKQSNSSQWDYTQFIVCCGDVMIWVTPDQFPQIERKII